jgi:hypothetical protein
VGSIRHADNLSSTRSETTDNLLCMPQGPIIIFDKSSLESLNLDEAVLLDNFYMSNITPLFELVHIGPQNVLATKSEKVA